MNLKEILVDPITKEELSFEEGTAKYKDNIYFYQEFWNFIPFDLENIDNEKWQSWNTLQKNGEISYIASPENNLGVGPRKDYIDFGLFCKYKGMILDVGVGPQKYPTQYQYDKNKQNFNIIGIDPLKGEQPREFEFVQGLGEYLPFKDQSFDQVVYATSLDHFIDPTETLLEAKRVLKENGNICIWIGEKDKNTPKPKKSHDWYEKLEIPKGAEDPFHFKRFTLTEFFEYLEKAGLVIQEEEIHEVDEWRKNCFYKIVKK